MSPDFLLTTMTTTSFVSNQRFLSMFPRDYVFCFNKSRIPAYAHTNNEDYTVRFTVKDRRWKEMLPVDLVTGENIGYSQGYVNEDEPSYLCVETTTNESVITIFSFDSPARYWYNEKTLSERYTTEAVPYYEISATFVKRCEWAICRHFVGERYVWGI